MVEQEAPPGMVLIRRIVGRRSTVSTYEKIKPKREKHKKGKRRFFRFKRR